MLLDGCDLVKATCEFCPACAITSCNEAIGTSLSYCKSMKNETSIASTYKSCDLLLTSLPKNVSRFLCNSSSGEAKPKRRLARPSLWFLWCCCRRPAALDILCQQRQPPRRHLLASQSQAMQDEHGSNLSIGGEQTSVRFFTID